MSEHPIAGAPVDLSWIIAGPPIPTLLVGNDGSRVWTGIGSPFVVVGAVAGDLYLDVDADTGGNLYRLT